MRLATAILFLVLTTGLVGCDSVHRAHQKHAITVMRDLGTQLMEHSERWQTSKVTDSATPATTRVEPDQLRQWLPGVELESLVDRWGRPLEVWVHDVGGTRQLIIRALGRDGQPDVAVPDRQWLSQAGSFPGGEPDRDIVWVDGYFVTWPEG